jgi:DNA-directed RNA polymerase specialized sigma24 family protein
VADVAARPVKADIKPEDFEELLLWLDPDVNAPNGASRERGAEKYEKIYQRIIKIYRNRGSRYAEEIADETMERVTRRVKTLRVSYEGDPALFFYGVAKKVYLEFLPAEGGTPPPSPVRDDPDEVEWRHECLERCLETLKLESRKLILSFYEGDKGEKIANRKRLSVEFGINGKALSLKVLKIRRKLLECMRARLGE